MDARDLAVTVVIPVLNDAARLSRCLRSIAANDRTAVDVIVVDNGSTDGSDRVAILAGATLIVRPGSCVSALRNAGAESAAGEILAFVDADHEICPNWVRALRNLFADARVAAAGAAYQTEGSTWVQRAYDGLRNRAATRTPAVWLGAGNFAVRRRVFRQVGGFDEQLQTCEDVDFCRRLRASGHTITADPDLASLHVGDPDCLSAVFAGETWRGRDNLAASLRRPVHGPTVASAVIPLVTLVAAVASMAALAGGAWRVATALALAPLSVLALRTVRICAARRAWSPAAILQAFAVASCYEAGRALGLIARANHQTRSRSRRVARAAAET